MNNLQILNSSILCPYQKIPAIPKRLKIAVIGNAGISYNDQGRIQESDVVIRFNNYATRQHIEKTSDPFRCDVLFSTFDLHSVGSKPKDVVIGIPFPFKAQEIASKPDRWYPKSRHWMVNPYESMKMCEELECNSLGYQHPFPSIGFTALWHMRNWAHDFYICGFNWYFDWSTKKMQGHDLKNKKYPKHWNHNYPKESEWMATKLGNNFIFSDDCQKILNYVKSCA